MTWWSLLAAFLLCVYIGLELLLHPVGVVRFIRLTFVSTKLVYALLTSNVKETSFGELISIRNHPWLVPESDLVMPELLDRLAQRMRRQRSWGSAWIAVSARTITLTFRR